MPRRKGAEHVCLPPARTVAAARAEDQMLLPFHDGRCSGNEKKYNNSKQSNLQSCEARQSRGQQGQSHVIIIVVIVVMVTVIILLIV